MATETVSDDSIEITVKTLTGRRVTVRALFKDSISQLKTIIGEQTSALLLLRPNLLFFVFLLCF